MLKKKANEIPSIISNANVNIEANAYANSIASLKLMLM